MVIESTEASRTGDARKLVVGGELVRLWRRAFSNEAQGRE